MSQSTHPKTSLEAAFLLCQVRSVGVMEKCNFCHQRVVEAKSNAKNEGRLVREGEIVTACQATCPTKAISFGNLQDKSSTVYADSQNERSYKILDQFINTQPAVTYFAKVKHGNGKDEGRA